MVCLLLGCGDLGIYGAALQPVGLCGNMLTASVSSCCGVQNFVHVYSIYIHIYNSVYKSISMELDFVKNAFGETIS